MGSTGYCSLDLSVSFLASEFYHILAAKVEW
jgi:hypothetical protein